jgi:NTP pyrophosphatase (non-canonical NTP hydrolase)
MDIQTLQATVRDFAAVRNWPRFHTPKNLAMALVVEAAELLEIFQWLTPEESAQAASDAPRKQHIGEEIADVLIYLLQLADHTRVDVAAAVRDKLQRNARKYPVPAGATDVSLPATAAATDTEAVTHVLLDYENVQPSEDQVRALVPRPRRCGSSTGRTSGRWPSASHPSAMAWRSCRSAGPARMHWTFTCPSTWATSRRATRGRASWCWPTTRATSRCSSTRAS